MKLDDNTRSALHYLGLATVVILSMLGIAWVLSVVSKPGDPSLIPFKHGYLLLPEDAVVVAHDPLGMRLATGFLVACAGSALAALLIALIARWLGSSSRQWAARSGTLSFVVLQLWTIATACFLPLQCGNPDQRTASWTITDRSIVFGVLAVPFSGSVKAVAFGEVGSLGPSVKYIDGSLCPYADAIMLTTRPPRSARTITQLRTKGDPCATREMDRMVNDAVRYLRHKTGLSDDQE